jgi:hypothetical protein
MSEDQDRVLAELAVEAGFLSREEAGHYWQRIQAPGSPRFVPLLVQEGRLSPPQLEQLKVRFYAAEQLRHAASGIAAAPVDQSAEDTFLEAGKHAEDTFLKAGSADTTVRGPSETDWDSALSKDTLLAQLLLDRRLVTAEHLAECRLVQLERLGVVLVQKGFVQRLIVEAAITAVLAHRATGAPDSDALLAAETQLDAAPVARGFSQATILDASAPIPLPGIFAQATILDDTALLLPDIHALNTIVEGPKRFKPGFDPGRQEEVSTVLNQPAIKAPDPFGSFSTGASIEELNPFAGLGAPGRPPPKVTRATRVRAAEQLGPPDSNTDIPVPSADSGPPPGGLAATFLVEEPPETPNPIVSRHSGLTPTGVPIGGEADSGSTRMKAREKAQLQRTRVKKRKRVKKGSGNFPLMLMLMLLGGLAIAAGLYFLLDLMN